MSVMELRKNFENNNNNNLKFERKYNNQQQQQNQSATQGWVNYLKTFPYHNSDNY